MRYSRDKWDRAIRCSHSYCWTSFTNRQWKACSTIGRNTTEAAKIVCGYSWWWLCGHTPCIWCICICILCLYVLFATGGKKRNAVVHHGILHGHKLWRYGSISQWIGRCFRKNTGKQLILCRIDGPKRQKNEESNAQKKCLIEPQLCILRNWWSARFSPYFRCHLNDQAVVSSACGKIRLVHWWYAYAVGWLHSQSPTKKKSNHHSWVFMSQLTQSSSKYMFLFPYMYKSNLIQFKYSCVYIAVCIYIYMYVYVHI